MEILTKLSFAAFIFVVVVLVGCTSMNEADNTNITLPIPSAIGTESSPMIPSATSSVTPTYTITPIPFPTGYEDYSPEDGWLILNDFLSNNLNCILPCWIGITPGSTNFDAALVFFDRFGGYPNVDREYPDGTRKIGIYGANSNDSPHKLISLFENDNSIRGINVISTFYLERNLFAEVWSSFSPKEILSKNTPDRIWIQIIRPEPNFAPYKLWLFFDDNNYLLIYSGIAELTPTGFQVCPGEFSEGNLSSRLQLISISPEEKLSLEEFYELTTVSIIKSSVKNLEDKSGGSIEDFSNGILNSDDQQFCISIESDGW